VLKVWDTFSGREFLVNDMKNPVTAIAFSPDDKHLAVAGRTRDVRMLRLRHDGKRLAAQCASGEVRMLDAERGHEISPLLMSRHPGTFAFSPDCKRLATGLIDGTVKVWDLTSGQDTLVLNGHTNSVSGLAFSPGGHHLISASTDMTVRTWDATPLAD
jgi:WD40 repeat protein